MGSIEVMSVDAVPVVKVEHLKELPHSISEPRARSCEHVSVPTGCIASDRGRVVRTHRARKCPQGLRAPREKTDAAEMPSAAYNERIARARRANNASHAPNLKRADSEMGQLIDPRPPLRKTVTEEEMVADLRIEVLQSDIAQLERRVSARFQQRKVDRLQQAQRRVLNILTLTPAANAAVEEDDTGTGPDPLDSYTEWQAVSAAGGSNYYWNTATNEVSWDPPWASAVKAEVPRQSSASSSASTLAGIRRSAHQAPGGVSYGGGSGRQDVASLVFKKYDKHGAAEGDGPDGFLSDDELAQLCAAFDRPLEDPNRLALFRSLLDADCDTKISRAEFVRWWRGGDDRWALLESDEHEAHVRGLAEFFDAFKPVDGMLLGDCLFRMHACLREHGHTDKSLRAFCQSIDEEGDQWVSVCTRMSMFMWPAPTPPHPTPPHPTPPHPTPPQSFDLALLLVTVLPVLGEHAQALSVVVSRERGPCATEVAYHRRAPPADRRGEPRGHACRTAGARRRSARDEEARGKAVLDAVVARRAIGSTRWQQRRVAVYRGKKLQG
jgi:hypothetical protein